jgi:hypothetical protein
LPRQRHKQPAGEENREEETAEQRESPVCHSIT